MNQNTFSVFKPTPTHQYQISYFNSQFNSYDLIDHYDPQQSQRNLSYYQHVQEYKNQNFIVNQSPTFSDSTQKIIISRTPSVTIKERKTKKYWTTEQKLFAVEKSKELGLSKTTKYLQKTLPHIYADLSPSTLQYWIYKNKTNSLI